MKNGDLITIGAEKRELTLEVPRNEMEARHKARKKSTPGYICGVLAHYAGHVTSASLDVPGRLTKTSSSPNPIF